LPCKVIRDEHGALYRVPAFTPKPENLTKLEPRPNVDVWWDRGTKKSDEDLYIRQDNGAKADVIVLTLGQAYDLIHALGSCIMDK
jgi:hypothetical protein